MITSRTHALQDDRLQPQQAAAGQDPYPTRGAEERLLPRVDPVVYGDGRAPGPHGLTPAQIDFYEHNGYLVVPDVFSAEEADELLREQQALAASEALRGREELILEPGSQIARSIFNPQLFSERFAALASDPRILDKVHQILDSEVYIHHARVNIKSALNGKSFPWHSDFETWHAEDGLPRCRVLSVWVMLTENNEFNGPLYVIPGSHKTFVSCAGETPDEHHRQSLRRQEYGVPSITALQRLAQERGLAAAHGAPGTLVLHEGNTMHGSAENMSPMPRTNLFFVYNSLLNRPAEKPFAADRFRPEFLGSRDFTPVRRGAGGRSA